MQMLQNHAGAQKSMGPMGVYKCTVGVQMYGGVQTWGCPNTPQV